MAKIAFLLLCHKDPEAIIAQARRLTGGGDCVSIHFDARSSDEDFQKIRDGLADCANVAFASPRKKCGWGEWSLVAATLSALRTAHAAFPDCTHFYMISGDCMPIKSAAYAHAFLDSRDCDFIESVDFFSSGWIKTGMKEDRLFYRHYFNERTHKTYFYGALNLQRSLGLSRRPPEDLKIMIGSQWWCLRRATIEKILAFCDERPDVLKFFRTTWIPDETFFQTLVRHLVADREIDCRTPTFLMFTDYGMPAAFYNDHYDLLLAQDFLFARKISPEAEDLKQRLGDLWASEEMNFEISNEGRAVHRFLTGRGRIGRRFGQRSWETGGSLGRRRTLLILCCKKWHVAQRVLEHVQTEVDLDGVGFLFQEDTCALPDLGGLETSTAKRGRHRRAVLNLIFAHYGAERLAICVDPNAFEILQDLYSDKAEVRLLEISCQFSDAYLTGHARRIGLASESTTQGVMAALLPTIRAEIDFETDQINDANFARHHRLVEGGDQSANAAALQVVFDLPPATARKLAEDPHLFDD